MYVRWLMIAVAVGILGGGVSTAATADAPVDPKLVSMYPFTLQRGATLAATVRGNGLREATAVFVNGAPLTATIESSEAQAADKTSKGGPFDLVHVRIQVNAGAKAGR